MGSDDESASPAQKTARNYAALARTLIDSFDEGTNANQLELLRGAKHLLTDALRYDSTMRVANLLMGNVYVKLDTNYESAAYYYTKILAQTPLYYDANYNMGVINMLKENYAPATTWFFAALKSDTAKTAPYSALGNCYFELDSGDKALYYYTRATEKDPLDDYAVYRLGIVYARKKNNLNKGEELIKKALTMNPNKALYYEDLSVAYGIDGKYQQCKTLLIKAIKQFPDYAPFYYNLYLTYKNLKDLKTANSYLQKAQQIAPGKYQSD